MLLNNLVTVAALASTILAAPVTNKTSDGRKMKWFGINESGPEWYDTRLPGIPGVDYKWPALSGIDTMLSHGHNMVRVNFCKFTGSHLVPFPSKFKLLPLLLLHQVYIWRC